MAFAMRAPEILRTASDPLGHLRDFEQLWIRSGYCRGLGDYGNPDDEAYVAHEVKQPEGGNAILGYEGDSKTRN